MMLRLLIVTLAFLSFSFNVNSQVRDSFESIITFSVSNMKFKTVEGSFSGMVGEVDFQPNDLFSSKFDVCIDAKSIDTGNEKRDEHLKNKDFFEVETYPKICFESSNISETSDGHKAKGTLTMHGVSKKIEIPFTFNSNQFNGEFKLNRVDYKIGGKGRFIVGKEITVRIKCVLV